MQGKGMTPFDGFNTVINVLMGTGPIMLPPAIALAGYSFSMIIMLIIGLFSIITGEFMIEILSIANCIKFLEFDQVQKEKEQQLINYESGSSRTSKSSFKLETLEDQGFSIREPMEYGMLGKMFWGKNGQLLNALNIIIYLYGNNITIGVIVGNTLSVLFQKITVMNNYYFWVVLFYALAAAMSFKDVASIAIVQRAIAIVRYITVFTMIIGCFVIYGYKGADFHIEEWNPKEFGNLFGIGVFSFLMHHSIPQMYKPINPQSAIRTVNAYGFLFATCVFFVIPFMAMIAFKDLRRYCYFNTVFDQPHVYFAYYIISFYMFLSVAAIPVRTITIRRNLMKMLVPHLMPKDSFQITKATFLFTMLVAVPCCIIALLLQNYIQFIVGISGGVCGTILMMVIPSYLVLEARKQCPLNPAKNPFRSFFASPLWAWTIFILGLLVVPYNIYLQLSSLVSDISSSQKGCLKSYDPRFP